MVRGKNYGGGILQVIFHIGMEPVLCYHSLLFVSIQQFSVILIAVAQRFKGYVFPMQGFCCL